MNLSDSLRSARLAAGLSRGQAAKRASIGKRTIDGLETGAHDPRYGTLVKLAGAYGVTVARLVTATLPAGPVEPDLALVEPREPHFTRWLASLPITEPLPSDLQMLVSSNARAVWIKASSLAWAFDHGRGDLWRSHAAPLMIRARAALVT